jgi:hypothetical protein
MFIRTNAKIFADMCAKGMNRNDKSIVVLWVVTTCGIAERKKFAINLTETESVYTTQLSTKTKLLKARTTVFVRV